MPLGRTTGGFLAAMLAGALGGALVGIAEAVLVTMTSASADEYWLFLFAVLSYGLLGAVAGLGWALLWQIVRRGRAPGIELAQFAVAIAVFFPALAVGRYHVAQRIFREGLVLASPSGAVAYALLFAGAALAALVAVVVVRACYRVAGSVGPAVALALLIGVSLVIGATTGETSDGQVARPAAAPEGRGKPNIIFIVADTLRADAVDWTGEQPGSSGGFARLASDGVVFDRAYSQSSWTRPSIASILTAQYPSAHGTMHKMDFLSDRALTVAEAMRAEGYWTAGFTTNINVAPIFNLSQGFDEFRYLEPSFYFGASDSATKLAIYKGLRTARERFFAQRMYFEHFYQDAGVVGENVAEWLGQDPPEPFFLFIHYMDPHDPFFEQPYNGRGVARVMTPSPPPEKAAAFHELYLQGVRYLDQYVMSLVGLLRESGVYDRSVVVFTSDHGEEFQEHGGWWHGTSLYEEQVHVPLVVKRSGETASGQRRADLVRTIDVAPTIMAAASLQAPAAFQGIDLFGGEAVGPLFAEEELEGNRLTSIRSGPWKLITANVGNPRGVAPVELYNLETDPGEKHNLAATEREKMEELRAELERMRAWAVDHGRRMRGTARIDVTDPRA